MTKFILQLLVLRSLLKAAHAYYHDYPYYAGKPCDSAEEFEISECSSPSVNEYTAYECVSNKTGTTHTQEIWIIVKQEKCIGTKSTCECVYGDRTTCKCVDPNVSCRAYAHYQRMECVSDGKGYIDYRCKNNDSSWIDNWVKEKEIKCRDPYSKCECYEDDEMEGSPQMCHCVDPR